jgi:hypothetical protein
MTDLVSHPPKKENPKIHTKSAMKKDHDTPIQKGPGFAFTSFTWPSIHLRKILNPKTLTTLTENPTRRPIKIPELLFDSHPALKLKKSGPVKEIMLNNSTKFIAVANDEN